MKRLIYALPILISLTFVSCSEQAPSEKPKEVKPIVEKPLLEREPVVNDYFEIMNEIIDEYMNVTETVLNTLEKLDKKELDYMETLTSTQDLLVSWNKLSELETSFEKQEDLKTSIEKKLNARDIAEFTVMYSKTLERFNELSARIQESDLNKYLK